MLALVVALVLPKAADAGPAVTARTALVMDANTGEVLLRTCHMQPDRRSGTRAAPRVAI